MSHVSDHRWKFSVFVLDATFDSLQEARDYAEDKECSDMQSGDGWPQVRAIETRVTRKDHPYEVSSFETYDRIKIMLEDGQ